MNLHVLSRRLTGFCAFAILCGGMPGAVANVGRSACPPTDVAARPAPQIAATAPDHAVPFTLREGDVVAFLGGEWVVQELETGHLESLLAASFPARGVRFCNLGWEGDTVFEQPRDVNFPGILEELRRTKATVAFLQFGGQESRAGREGVPGFVAAYERLCDELIKQTPRLVLVTPPPVDKSSDPPSGRDARSRNADMALYAAAVRDLAKRRGYPCVDLFSELGSIEGPADLLTDHGIPTPRGQARVALAAAHQLGLAQAAHGGAPAGPDAHWASPEMESLRQAVVAKNRLWFRYHRPTNWAFLGGDRTSVPSSHDHRDPAVRWFPAEMEQYLPLIDQAQARADELARGATGAK